jgi:hypothetical protein
MGWLFYTTTRTRKDECDHVLTHDGDKSRLCVIDSAMVGSTYYAAVERTDKETGVSYIFGAVLLTKGRSLPGEAQDGHNFGYKDMDESSGPNESKCPLRILNKLSPLDHPAFNGRTEYAQAWRDRCRAYHGKQKPKAGQRVTFAEPITFTDGSKLAEFVYVTGSKFRTAYTHTGGLYQIRGWKDRAYTIA